MKINFSNAELKLSAGRLQQFPREPLPQIAFSGRSNVGKSSLLNTLLNRKKLARVSATPGKTITVNFYNIDRKIYLVDLPGYGFAKRPREEKELWSELTEGYFTKNPSKDALKLVLQLIDARIGPTDDDIMMINYLIDNGIPFRVVATKADKLSKAALEKQLNDLHNEYFLGTNIEIIPFSSETAMGKDILWSEILRAVEK
jgi:GTP-binding protein